MWRAAAPGVIHAPSIDGSSRTCSRSPCTVTMRRPASVNVIVFRIDSRAAFCVIVASIGLPSAVSTNVDSMSSSMVAGPRRIAMCICDAVVSFPSASSDHIRMPAVYAIAEIAASTGDSRVKVRALTALGEPLRASQVPIRDVAIDAVNLISRSADDPLVSQAAVRLTTDAFAALERDPALGRAEALRRAMTAMLDAPEQQAFRHPMFWAPFVIAGEGGAGR